MYARTPLRTARTNNNYRPSNGHIPFAGFRTGAPLAEPLARKAAGLGYWPSAAEWVSTRGAAVSPRAAGRPAGRPRTHARTRQTRPPRERRDARARARTSYLFSNTRRRDAFVSQRALFN